MTNKLLTLFLFVALVFSGIQGFGRNGLSIRSTGNSNSWNNASAWLIIKTGISGSVVPQGDDTIYIEHHLLLNEDFNLTSGRIVIDARGSLQSETASLIMGGQSVVECNGSLVVSNLAITDRGDFILSPSANVTVNNNLYISDPAQLLIQSLQGESGSLITNGQVEGQVTMEYVVPANMNRLVSSPVYGAESGVFLNMYLRNYNEPASGWGNYIVPTTIPMNPMEGYEVLSLYDDKRTFRGVPYSGEQNINITSMGNGWNLIGNPYPSPIDWSLLGTGNDAGNYPQGVNTLYYPDNSGSGNFSIFCPGEEPISINCGSHIVKPMQGFFIRSDHSSNISVTNEMRVHSNGSDGIASLPTSAISFTVNGNNYSDEAVIRFDPDATDNFDIAFDAYKLPGIDTAPEIFFTTEDGSKLALNSLGTPSSGLVVPIYVTTPYTGSSSLHIRGASMFRYRYPVYLEDVSTGVYMDLRSDSVYYFDSNIGNTTHEFKLHFSSPGGIRHDEASSVQITAGSSEIVINDIKGQSGNVDVFMVDGRKLVSVNNTSLQLIKIPVTPGMVYIVRVTTGDGKITRKLYIAP